jgi:hypothetical protein
MSITKEYLEEIRMLLVECSYEQISIDTVLNKLKDFSIVLKTISDRETFIENNLMILSAIKFEINYLMKESHIISRKQDLIRIRDKLFGSLLKSVELINERTKVTKIFNEFIIGITYFQNELTFNENSLIANAPNIRIKKTNAIRKCYIERLIYDKLWTRIIFTSQDIDHIEWLNKTKTSYNTCFPNSELNIKINFDEQNNIPIELIVYENDVKEVYKKRYDQSMQSYIYPVYCTLYEPSGPIKHKQTTFTTDIAWT